MPLHTITYHYIPLGPVAIQVKGSQRLEKRIRPPKVRLFGIEYFIQGGGTIHFLFRWVASFSNKCLNILIRLERELGKELRKEFNHQNLDQWNPNTLF